MSTTHDVSQPSTEMTQALAEAEAAFRRETPAYATTSHLDDLRATEYGRLDRQGHVYLDYTGGGLYAESQVRAHMELLSANVFGNPHSSNPTSMASTEHVEADARGYPRLLQRRAR